MNRKTFVEYLFYKNIQNVIYKRKSTQFANENLANNIIFTNQKDPNKTTFAN